MLQARPRQHRSAAGITLLEPVNTSRSVDQLLLAGKERVARRTNFYMQFVLQRRTRLERTAACTSHRYLVVVRMYFLFHN